MREETYPNEEEQKEFMKKHLIPSDINLEFTNFEEFVNKRSKLIREKLKVLLV